MTLTITPVHLSDNAAIETLVDVISTVRQHDIPEFIRPDVATTRLMHEHQFPGRRTEYYLAWHDGTAVGRLELIFPTLENLRNMHFDLEVVPAFRRQGFGTAMLRFALDRARSEERSNIVSTTTWNRPETIASDPAGARFAEAAGFTPALVDVLRRLRAAEVDEQALSELRDHALERASGYRVVTWRGLVPQEWIADIAYLDGRLLTDAPLGDLEIEAESVDADRIRASDRVAALRGRTSWHAGTVHEQSGRMVAWTMISREAAVDGHAWQQITIVDPDHRGHRLGMLVKVENLRFLRADQPDVHTVDTFNAAENSYMISINEQMGFRPVYAFQNWQIKI